MVVIGAGRIGTALSTLGRMKDQPVQLVNRTGGWTALDGPAGNPVLVATRNNDLAEVIGKTPAPRRADLVFVQNGMIQPLLASRGLEEATRGLLFFAVPTRGALPTLGPASPFHGRHAEAVVRFLRVLGLPSEVVSEEAFAAVELEKLIWNCALGLLCQAHNATVGEVVDKHGDDLRAVVTELHAVGQTALELKVPLEPLLQRIQSYSVSIRHYRGAVKEVRWRNGWFRREADRRSLSMPQHEALWRGLRLT